MKRRSKKYANEIRTKLHRELRTQIEGAVKYWDARREKELKENLFADYEPPQQPWYVGD